MYDDEPYNDAEQDVIQHVAEDIDDIENGRASRRRAYVSKADADRLDLNISTKNTNQKLSRLPLAILSRIFRSLLRIELSGNDLGVSGLPAQFEKCEALYYVKLEYCSLPKIPDVICRLHSLVVLDIRHNKIDHLPPGLQDLKNLRVLSLSFNLLRELPTFLTQVGSLKTIDVTGNPLEAPPRAVWDDTLPQNRGMEGLEKTRRILQWLAERKNQTASSMDAGSMEPIRPGSLVPRPLNLSKPSPSPQPSITTSTTRSTLPNRSGSMDTTISDAVTDAPELTLNPGHAIYLARKIGKAYYQLVQHVAAELKVVRATGTVPSVGSDFVQALRALEECAKDLIALDTQHDVGTDKVKLIVQCGAQLLSDVLRFFLEDISATADEEIFENMPLLFEMVDRNITTALQEVGIRFPNGNTTERLLSLFQAVGPGTFTFTYTGQLQTAPIAVKVPEFRIMYHPPSETPASTLSYANSAISSTTDLQQAARIEDEPYELVGEVIANGDVIYFQLNDLLAKGLMQSTPAPIHKLWSDSLVAVQILQNRAQVLHNELANFSANDIANLRDPFNELANAVVALQRVLTKLSKISNYVSEATMAACKAIKTSVTTAMKLLDGARSSAITPISNAAAAGTSSISSYAPTTPMGAALGPAAARMVGKDTSSLFKKIDDLHKKERRF